MEFDHRLPSPHFAERPRFPIHFHGVPSSYQPRAPIRSFDQPRPPCFSNGESYSSHLATDSLTSPFWAPYNATNLGSSPLLFKGSNKFNYQSRSKGDDLQDKHSRKDYFFCEACNKGFHTSLQLSEHKALHIKCGYDGCKFEAHPKVVQSHVRMQHNGGFACRFLQLETPEEIEKWRQERRKNYPTASNIARKKFEHAQKIDRGEVLLTQEFGKMKKRRSLFRSGRGSHRWKGGRGGYGATRTEENGSNVKIHTAMHSRDKRKMQSANRRNDRLAKVNDGHMKKGNLRRFQGTRVSSLMPGDVEDSVPNLMAVSFNLPANEEKECECTVINELRVENRCEDSLDVECEVGKEVVNSVVESLEDLVSDEEPNPVLTHVQSELCSNMAEAEIAETSVFNEPQVSCTERNIGTTSKMVSKSDPLSFILNDNIKESSMTNVNSTCTIASSSTTPVLRGALASLMASYASDTDEDVAPVPKEVVVEPISKPKNVRPLFVKPRLPHLSLSTRRTSLLEKLLAKEIRKERNIILQCVRFIVKNNFLQSRK